MKNKQQIESGFFRRAFRFLLSLNPIFKFLLISSFTVCFLFFYSAYLVLKASNTNFDSESVKIYIKTTDDFEQIRLKISPYLKSTTTFDLANKLISFHTNGGLYVIKRKMSNYEIIKMLRMSGKTVKVTFNNIETLDELAGRVSRYIEADSISLSHSFKDSVFLVEKKFTKWSALAMYIPNSYDLFWNTTADKFRKRMLNEYNRFWNESRTKKLKSLNISKQGVITLASIIQKESNKAAEYTTLAGVYINRLKRNIPLQADPTVVYAIKRKNQNFDLVIRRVLYRDLKINSPYNTYKIKGLPPGPIITPNISTIDSVLNYKKHDYIFFIADVENPGYHMFARNIREHRRNKKSYIKWLNKNKIRR